MYKFLKGYKLPKPSEEEIENLNTSVGNTEIEWGIKNLPTKESLCPKASMIILSNIYRRNNTNPSLSVMFQNVVEGGTILKSFYEASINLAKSKTSQEKKRKCRQISFINMDIKIPTKMFIKWTQQNIKRIIYHGRMRFFPEMQG